MEKWESKLVKERQDTEFYIDPQGKIRKWKGSLKELDNWVSTHSLLAQTITGIKDGTADEYLHKLGWIAMGSAVYGNRIKGEPTQAQINTLFDLGRNGIIDDNGIRHYWK